MDTLKYRVMPDGSIVFPARGTPPKQVSGYKRTSDPLVWIPDLEPCCKRQYPKRVKPCGKIDYPMTCIELGEVITYKTCEECELDFPDATVVSDSTAD